MTLKEKLKKTGENISCSAVGFTIFQFSLCFITFHMFKALKKIDLNLPFFQKINQTFQTIFSKQGMFESKLSIGLNVVFGSLALASFIFTCHYIYDDIFEKENKISEHISESLAIILFASLPFLFVIPIGFVNPDLMKFGMIAFAVFAFSKIVMESIMIGFNFSGINLGRNVFCNTYEKINRIKNPEITEFKIIEKDEEIITRYATKMEKLQAIFFEVILCFPSFAVEFLIESISKGIGKGTELVVDGISKVFCGGKSTEAASV